jgi:hypothetical protein
MKINGLIWAQLRTPAWPTVGLGRNQPPQADLAHERGSPRGVIREALG